MFNWQDFLEPYINGPKYKQKYERCSENFALCDKDKQWLIEQLSQRDELIRQLKLLVPREPPPEITYIVEKDTVWVQRVIDSMGMGIIRLPLDIQYRLTNHSNMLNIVAWDTTDKIKYIKEKFDCENFAILFKAIVDLYFHLNQVALIIDYVSKHSYNLILYPNGKHQVCEPKSDGLYLWTDRLTNFYSMKGAIVII